MKEGKIVNRVVMLVLLGAVLVYLFMYAWRSFTDRMVTMTCYTYTLDQVTEATGLLVRDEYVLPARSGLVEVLPAEGERVGVGQTLAYLYQDAAALERRQQLDALSQELEQIKYSLSHTDDMSDNAKLSEEILSQIASLRSSVAARDFTSLEDDTMELRALVYKRDYSSTGDITDLQNAKAELESQIQALTTAAGQDTTSVVADRAGVFSSMVDGWESLITPAMLETLTPSQLTELEQSTVTPEDGTVGKLITSTKWYFACVLDEDDAGELANLRDDKKKVTVRFSRDWSGEVDMTVERISDPENGKVVAVLSSKEFLSDTTLLRAQTVSLVYSSTTGIRIPKNALYQNGSGQWGVYAIVGAFAEFKPVEIVGDEEDYYLVNPVAVAPGDNNEAKRSLRAGDEIILSGEELYDGKVVRG
ncbi:HlyD family efflux transporter periplasmic adaptor subunit [uncultured Pseudoflavonifractor sp.]|uniref:HlyD family efflux transporter periplasmic adaptor subunit n=1 Tax=uncultured Pseudoflavonifractor sp. TaxID=1221379 RepID=UPI0025CC82DB|nr:HlyD family efflux transporter periplasmic adaptor subunit [uncultured Pseudoflavonifractor sp.]